VLFSSLEALVLFLPLVLAVPLRLRGSSRETNPTSSCSRWQSATWIGWPASRASSRAPATN